MSLFDNISVTTKYGTLGLASGKLVADVGAGLEPPRPTPLTPANPPPMSTGLGGWLKSNPRTAVGIAVAAVLAIVLLRR